MTDASRKEAIIDRERAQADIEAASGDVGAAARRLRDLKGYLNLSAELSMWVQDDADASDLAGEPPRARLERKLLEILAEGQSDSADGDAGP